MSYSAKTPEFDDNRMTIEWIDPAKAYPPFNKRILVLLGGQGSNDGCRTWDRYATLADVVVLKQSPNDSDTDDTPDQFVQWFGEEDRQAAYDKYQFDVVGWPEYEFEDAGGEWGEEADWYSDSIVAWAPIPDFSFALSEREKAG